MSCLRIKKTSLQAKEVKINCYFCSSKIEDGAKKRSYLSGSRFRNGFLGVFVCLGERGLCGLWPVDHRFFQTNHCLIADADLWLGQQKIIENRQKGLSYFSFIGFFRTFSLFYG